MFFFRLGLLVEEGGAMAMRALIQTRQSPALDNGLEDSRIRRVRSRDLLGFDKVDFSESTLVIPR